MAKKATSQLATITRQIIAWVLQPVRTMSTRVASLKARRPHRSFRRTRRRDYSRSLRLPGYWAFTFYVLVVLRLRLKLFIWLALLYTLLSVVFGGMTSQDTYSQISDLVSQGASDVFTGSWGAIGQAGLLASAAFTGGTNSMSDVQQAYLGVIVLLTWLTTVWLLREHLAERRPGLRDGLYNAGAPFVSTLLVAVYALLQLVPVGLLAIAYSGLASVGLLEPGFSWLLFSAIAIVIAALTLYWLTSTFIALVVVTLPGMYPSNALRAAGDLVVGRRLRVLYRILWMMMLAIIAWFVIMIPLILLDSWLRSLVDWRWIEWLPVVPFLASLASALTAIWAASYIYLMYRKVVDDDAAPA